MENKEGVLSRVKVKAIIMMLSPYGLPRKDDLENVMRALDCDGDGRVDVKDLELAMHSFLKE